MSKSQKLALIRFAVRLAIIIVLLILIVCQYKSINSLKSETKGISERITAIETAMAETADKTEPDEAPLYFALGEFKITGYDAYCEHCCGKSDGITASMTKATVGRTVAMNRTDMKKLGIEYGDVILIEGIGERVVEDTGCGQGVVDVVCYNHEECYKITGYSNVLLKGGD